MGTVTVTAQCDPYLSLDWCAAGGECMEISALIAEPTSWASTCGPPVVGGGGGGGGGTGTGGTGSGLYGDADGDGDTLDEGPTAFAGCVARGIGLTGASALVAAGWSAYEAWDRRQDTREAHSRWFLYHQRWDIPGAAFDPELDKLHYQLWKEAESEEQKGYALLAGTTTIAAYKVGAAVALCAPLFFLPTP